MPAAATVLTIMLLDVIVAPILARSRQFTLEPREAIRVVSERVRENLQRYHHTSQHTGRDGRPSRGDRMVCRMALSTALWLALASASAAQNGDVPRTASGRPDLSGTYDVATQTALERSESLADFVTLTDEAAAEFAERGRRAMELSNRPTDPNRGAPPVGGARTTGNAFWIDPGEGTFKVNGQWRTSILIDPPNGRYPPRLPGVPRRGRSDRRQFDGTADWLAAGLDAPGPYDNMEQFTNAERCLSIGSTAAPPMLPALYNNIKRIVQTEDTVMILSEMVHDARIIRMNAEHDPPEIKKWLGDSVGWWDDDLLIVETTNFVDRPAFEQGTSNMTVTEGFWFDSDATLIYTFTVEDPTVWTASFTGQYAWPRSENRVFEYACHEGDYPLAGIMTGARLLEAVFRGEDPKGVVNPTR
jgi:hypothetical protein